MKSRGSILRGAAVLAVALVAAGAFAISPAVSAGKPLTKAKALKLFYTKAQAEERFLDKVEGDAQFLDQGEGDARFLNTGEKAGDADTIDGVDSIALARKLDNVVTVSASGGDFTSIQAAIDSITDESGANPYLVLVGPGTYNERVTMANNINLQGSGDATRISAAGATTCTDAFTLRGATAFVSDLMIRNTGGATCSLGVLNPVGSASTYQRVNIQSFGGTSQSIGMRNDDPPNVTTIDSVIDGGTVTGGADAIGLDNLGTASLQITRTRIIADAPDQSWALNNTLSTSVTIQASELFAFGGTQIGIVMTATGTITARGSVIDGANNTLNNSTGTVNVATSQLSGGPTTGAGTRVCAGVYDEAFVWSDSTCPA